MFQASHRSFNRFHSIFIRGEMFFESCFEAAKFISSAQVVNKPLQAAGMSADNVRG